MGSTTSVLPCRGENRRSSLAGRSFSPAFPSRPGLFGTPSSNCSRLGHSLVPSHRVQRRGLGQDPLLLLHRAPPAPRGLPGTGRRTFKRARAISLAARRISRRSGGGGGGVWREGGWRGGLSHHLRCRALFAYFVFSFVQVALCATLQNVQGHQRNKKSASLTLSVDLNSANECQCMCVRRQEEMRLFPPDAQPRPTIQSQINTKEAGTGLLATKARGLELRLKGPWPATEGQEYALHNFKGVHCSDRDSCNTELQRRALFGS